MLESELHNHIIKIYKDISNIVSIEKVKEGYLSQNYILKSAKGEFFLKQYRDKYTRDDINDIDKVTSFFSQNNIPVILPLPTNQDKKYFIFNNKIYSLFPFASGVKLDKKDIDKKSIKSLAKTLAKIHLLSLNGLPIQISARQGAIDSTRFLKDSPKILKVLDSLKKKNSFDKLALEGLCLKRSIVEGNIEKIKSLKVKADHLLHGDYHEKNVFVDSKGEIKYIFDLEKTELGDRLHEVIRSMDFVCLNQGYDAISIKRARVYIQAYNELYPIHQEDFSEALEDYYFKKANSLWIERTHYLEGSHRVDCFLETQLESLKFFPKNFDRLGKLLEA